MKLHLNEQWKDIRGYEGLYQISDMGRVASYDRISSNGKCLKGKILSQTVNHFGYLQVRLLNKILKVHRLVAIHFIPNPDNKPEVNHLNGDKFDNRCSELEWTTELENKKHASITGLKDIKLNAEQTLLIRWYLENTSLIQKEIAEMFGVAPCTVSHIKNERIRKYIK